MSFSFFLFLGLVALLVLMNTLATRQRRDAKYQKRQIELLDRALTDFRDRLEVLEGNAPPADISAEPSTEQVTDPTQPETTGMLSFFTDPDAAVEPPLVPIQIFTSGPAEDEEAPSTDETEPEQEEVQEEEPVPAAALVTPPIETTAPAKGSRAKEEAFTSSWLIWIGGVTMALGGAFIVKFSIDQGYFGPAARIILGLLLGAGLLGIGEYLRRSSEKTLFQRQAPDYLPGTLTGVGILTLYASVWAAYGLYDMVSSVTAFAALALIAFGSLALGLLHGPAIAALGMVGATIVPAIVSTGSRSTNLLFTYLAIVSVGGMAVVRYRQWWRLGGLTLAAGMVWATIWLATAVSGESVIAPGTFIIAISIMGLWANRSDHPMDSLRWDNKPLPFATAGIMAVAGSVVSFALLHFDSNNLDGILIVFGYATLMVLAGLRRREWVTFPLLAGALLLISLGTWGVAAVYLDVADQTLFDLSSHFGRFTALALASSLLFGLSGFGAAFRKPNPGYWASLSVAAPLILLILSYVFWSDFGTDTGWAGVAMGLAFVFTLAAERHKHTNTALGAYAVGAFSALSLALALYLHDAWLTVALSLQIPAMAYLCVRLDLPVLRRIALVIGVVIIARLGFNPFIFSYELGNLPLFNWILWGYGLPAIAFWWSAGKFRETADDRVVKVLEAGAIAFLTIFVTLEIRTFFQDSLDASYNSFAEASVQTLAWMGIGYGLYRRNVMGQRTVLSTASLLLRYGGLAHMALFTLIVNNPVVVPVELGDWPILNLSVLAYLGPAIITGLYAVAARQRDDQAQFSVMAGIAVALAHIWLFMEIRQIFYGSLINVPYNNLLEVSVQTLGFLGLNYGLSLLANRFMDDALDWLLNAVRWVGLLQMVFFHFLVVNPLFIHTNVGAPPLFNVLMLAFAAPALITGYMAWQALQRDDDTQVTILGAATLIMIFTYISLSVRQFYTGGFLDEAAVSDPEQYTYSVVWILYGIGLLWLGIKSNIRALRYASLGVLMVATAKVFIWDMSGLTGLLRAVSFLGLGGTLLAIGFVYQRFVFPAAPAEDTAEESVN